MKYEPKIFQPNECTIDECKTKGSDIITLIAYNWDKRRYDHLIIDHFRPCLYVEKYKGVEAIIKNNSHLYKQIDEITNAEGKSYICLKCYNISAFRELFNLLRQATIKARSHPDKWYEHDWRSQLFNEKTFGLYEKHEFIVASLPDSETGIKRWRVSRKTTGQKPDPRPGQ